FRAQAREQHLGARVGERGDGVVLGEPVTVVAERVGAAREGERLLDRTTRAEAADHRRLIEDREPHRAMLNAVAWRRRRKAVAFQPLLISPEGSVAAARRFTLSAMVGIHHA